MLEAPAPGDWLTWRRTPDGWGYSPLDQIDRDNVHQLRMVWSRGLAPGRQEGTPLAYDGVLYMPQANDVIDAIDAVTGDLRWQHRRDLPDDIYDHVGANAAINRNIAIYDRFIINTSDDVYVFGLDAETGELAWETQIFDYTEISALHSSGPIIADGKAISGRSCGRPEACVIVAHDARTGEKLWRRRTIPAPGEPGDETWGGVPFEERRHVGTWMPPSYDHELRLVYQGTSVTAPAPKFMLGGVDNRHIYHNSTLALVPRLRRRDRRGPLGDQPRLGGHRLPDQLRGRRPAVHRGRHRLFGNVGDLHRAGPGAAPQPRQQPVRVRVALKPDGFPQGSAGVRAVMSGSRVRGLTRHRQPPAAELAFQDGRDVECDFVLAGPRDDLHRQRQAVTRQTQRHGDGREAQGVDDHREPQAAVRPPGESVAGAVVANTGRRSTAPSRIASRNRDRSSSSRPARPNPRARTSGP